VIALAVVALVAIAGERDSEQWDQTPMLVDEVGSFLYLERYSLFACCCYGSR
jgi:hypothetical protein